MTVPGPEAGGRRPEDAVWSVLELVAAHQGLDREPDERADRLRQAGFDHGRLVEQAMRHGLLAALADFLTRHGLRRTLPPRLRNPVLDHLRLNRHRARLLTTEAARIAERLAGAGVRAAWTKGVVLQSTLYDDTGIRTYKDIDVMIAPGDRDRVRTALVALGYEPATVYDHTSGELHPISRAAARIYQLSPDHLPHFHRLLDDVCVPYVSVDVANSFTWHGSPWQVPVEQALERIERVTVLEQTPLWTLSGADSFLFVCLHLFREGWIRRTAAVKDLSLAQFADIARHWDRAPAAVRRSVADRVAELGLAAPVAWACGHTDAVLGTGIVSELGLTRAATPGWLSSLQDTAGRQSAWHGDMRRRLRSPGSPHTSTDVPESQETRT